MREGKVGVLVEVGREFGKGNGLMHQRGRQVWPRAAIRASSSPEQRATLGLGTHLHLSGQTQYPR